MNSRAHATRMHSSEVTDPYRIPSMRNCDFSQTATTVPVNASHQYNQLAVSNPSLSSQACLYQLPTRVPARQAESATFVGAGIKG
jgi:hypothetical protein